MHFSIIYLNSKNIDPKFESSFANKLSLQSRLWVCNAKFFSNETIFCDVFQSLANFQTYNRFKRSYQIVFSNL